MDFYLDNKNVVARLKREREKYGSLVVAYDFDNTVYDFHKEGHKYPLVIDLLRECKEMGDTLIVFTASTKYKFIEQYLKENNIPYDLINENPPFFITAGEVKKIYYNILLDDRAGLESAYNALKEVNKLMKEGK